MEKTFNYENQEITFELDKEKNLMVNATEMAKVYGKEVACFMENDGTKNFIKTCLKTRNSSFLNLRSEDDLYISRQKSGISSCLKPANAGLLGIEKS